MTKELVERFTCDAPKCEDVAEIPAPAGGMLVGASMQSTLPDGWIEFSIVGTALNPGQSTAVHASRPQCAAALAGAQVEQAVEAVTEREKADEEQREKAEAAINGEPAPGPQPEN